MLAGLWMLIIVQNKTQMERLKREQNRWGNDEIMTAYLLHPGPFLIMITYRAIEGGGRGASDQIRYVPYNRVCLTRSIANI